MSFILFTLMACAPQDLVIQPSFGGCEEWDPDDPPAEQIRVQQEDLATKVIHDAVFQPSDATFDPTITLDGNTIKVREYWTEGTAEDFCFQAWIELKDPPGGKYSAEWYLGDNDNPVEIVDFEVE